MDASVTVPSSFAIGGLSAHDCHVHASTCWPFHIGSGLYLPCCGCLFSRVWGKKGQRKGEKSEQNN